MKQHSTILPPIFSISLQAASAVPPVAIRSSTSNILSPLCDRVGVDLDAVGAVFEFVVVAYGLGGQLAFLADRNEALAQRVGQRRAEDEAARLDAGDLVDLHVLVAAHQVIYRDAKTDRVLEQGGDVAELDVLAWGSWGRCGYGI